MDIQKLSATWLGPCPTCERTEHKVKTIKGTKDYLYEGDEVDCWCGQTGLIDTDGMEGAWCEWHAKEITEYDKFNDYYRKKYPENWALLPCCNHQACTHHEELFNSWMNAKAQAVPEGFVLVPEVKSGKFSEKLDEYLDELWKSGCGFDDGFVSVVEINHDKIWSLVIEAQEQSHE